MHIVEANFYLLRVTGPKMPADFKEDSDTTVTSEADVIRWLKRSLEAVKRSASGGEAGRPTAQGAHLRQGCDCGRYLPENPGACK